jgi:hypothetical protein
MDASVEIVVEKRASKKQEKHVENRTSEGASIWTSS